VLKDKLGGEGTTIPKGWVSATYIRRVVKDAMPEGLVKAAIERAELRGSRRSAHVMRADYGSHRDARAADVVVQAGRRASASDRFAHSFWAGLCDRCASTERA